MRPTLIHIYNATHPHSHHSHTSGTQYSRLFTRASNQSLGILKLFDGTDFFDGWDFFDRDDPTNGHVDYVSENIARNDGLVSVDQKTGVVTIAVDSKTKLNGEKRKSVRIASKERFNKGLFILDALEMPFGCSVWPMWWTVGGDWPSNGEIDIVEGVHNGPRNVYSLHTKKQKHGGKCSLNKSKKFSGNVQGREDCRVSNDGNYMAGCSIADKDKSSYGEGFKKVGGGVWAMLWDSEGIRTWHWTRGAIPADVKNKKPRPGTWKEPAAFFEFGDKCPAENFKDHAVILSTSLCGDRAGNTFKSAGCGESCINYVKDPAHFKSEWELWVRE